MQDEEVALEFLKEAEEGKDNLWESILGDVLNALGVAYAFGKGAEEDIKLGYQYFENAARLGSGEAKEFIDYINSSDYDTDKREEADNERPVAPFYQGLAETIREASTKDIREILNQTADENIYTVALVTDSNCCSLFLAVNTVEYLNNETDGLDECKWHPDEWGYSDGHGSELVKLSASLWENYSNFPGEKFFFNALISAMKQIKESGIFKDRADEITFFVSISDDEGADNIEDLSAKQLNSPTLAAAFLNRTK